MFSKYPIAALAIVAGVVQASPHDYHHLRLHRRAQAYNESSTAGDIVFATSTVYSTQEITVTSCAKTVTDCPADKMTETFVTTVIVPAYTTICPVTATQTGGTVTETVLPVPASTGTAPVSSTIAATAKSSFSSSSSIVGTAPLSTSVAASFLSTTTLLSTAPSVPLSTGSPTFSTAIAPGNGFSTSMYISNSTLTYTLGTGTSATVVTTTYFHTSTLTIYDTVTATLPSTPESTNNGAGSGSGPTTTILSTSTSTVFVTVIPASPSAGSPGAPGSIGSPESTNNGALGATTIETSPARPTGVPGAPGAPGGGSTETDCVPPVTVTVTSKEIVTITAGAPSLSQSAAPTFSSAPYTFANGTMPTTTKWASTGFITRPYPTASSSGSGSIQWGAIP